MNVMDMVEAKRIKVGALRQSLFEVVEDVLKKGKVVVVTVHGDETVAMLPSKTLFQLLNGNAAPVIRPEPEPPTPPDFRVTSKIKSRAHPDSHYDADGRYAGPPATTGHRW